jgi:polysaccharide deacetylase family protein (PEP-CTERM system associated)
LKLKQRAGAPHCKDCKSVPNSIFSIDVEDWFNLSGTGAEPPPSEWDGLESRLEKNFHGLLELLATGGGTATCFVVGYFGRRFPMLIREAVAAGHEIAAHGYYHRLIYDMSPAEFYQDALNARKVLEDLSGRAVTGFRAPAFSVTERTPWFFEKLVEAGYGYDSSVFPAPHQTGGLASGKFAPYHVTTSAGQIEEFPITALRVLGKPMCFFGGGYLRLFPYQVICTMARRAQNEGRPTIFYVHPREIDPQQPRLPLSLRRRFTCYVNLKTTRPKIVNILRDFKVTSFEHYRAQRTMQ